MSALLHLRRQRNNPPKPTTTSFAGKTVLITGATSGLGLEAAKKIAALGADKLIISARDQKRGQAARQQILAHVETSSSDKDAVTADIVVELLDMSRSTSVIEFADRINLIYRNLNAVILNAGGLQAVYSASDDGWEETMQVNTINTTLLGVLLLPKLLQNASPTEPAHLAFISSGTATRIKPETMRKYYQAGNALGAMSQQENFPGGQTQYAISKLLLEYSMRHIAMLPRLMAPDGKVKVVVNSACPGLCKSDLGRQFTKSIFFRIIMWLMYALFARTAEQGSNTYVSALIQSPESQGKLWKDDKYYNGGEMIETEEAKTFGDKIWKEMVEVISGKDSRVREIVS